MSLIIYPYWILNDYISDVTGTDSNLIIYPYWILNTVPTNATTK